MSGIPKLPLVKYKAEVICAFQEGLHASDISEAWVVYGLIAFLASLIYILYTCRSNASTILICHDAQVSCSCCFFLFLFSLLGWNFTIFSRIESTDSSKRTENRLYLALSNHWYDKAIRSIDSTNIYSQICVGYQQSNRLLLG